ncbi:MAG: hypothetical protein Q7J06_06860, partial [Bacteroidales bacterium]|nr:hypothetical protein [Bacteroidales bacterium]
MKKINKPAILIVVSILLLQSSYGQVHNDMADYLKQKFLRYSEAVPREEIFLHSDREEYIAGEDLWFNIYLIDRQSFKPTLNSRIAYFELLNAENRPVVQKRILLDKRFGPGHIVLPDTLSTGTYTIRAYTNWMKNFLPYNCFLKDITVYNTLSTKPFKGKFSTGNINEKETGNKVAAGIINTGATLRVNNTKPDILEIFVNTHNKFRSENNNLFYIFIQTHGNINYVGSEKMNDETTKVVISKALLGRGINQITIFNSKGKPVDERYIYTPVKENNIVTLHSVDSCNLRNKITLEIEVVNEASTALHSTNLSISVAPQTDAPEIMDINDYMVFGTEYGTLGWNTIKGRKNIELISEVMDSILLNVRSNWINWETILSGDLPHFKYQIENEDHALFGKLLTNDQQEAHPNEFILLCTPGAEAGFQYTRTDNEGNFSFSIHIDEEHKDLIIMPDDVNNNGKIIIESSFSDQYLNSEIYVDSINAPIPSNISKLSVNYQVRKIFGVSSLGGPLNPIIQPVQPIRFYGKPDIELVMADYISLPVMEEVFFELLPHISLKKKNSIYEISITDRVDNSPYFTSPCLLIDGVIIKDASLIAN